MFGHEEETSETTLEGFPHLQYNPFLQPLSLSRRYVSNHQVPIILYLSRYILACDDLDDDEEENDELRTVLSPTHYAV